MDALSNVLSAMKLSGSVFLEANFSSPWCVTSELRAREMAAFFPEAQHVISYHYVAAGELQCAVGSEPPVTVRAGQILMLPKNERHLLGSAITDDAVDSAALFRPCDDGLLRIDWGGGGAPTQIYCGFLGSATPINAFVMSLPSVLVIDASTGTTGEWLASSVRFASGEAQVKSPEMVGRLAELLFAEGVKQYTAQLPPEASGWFAGLRDPHVSRALTMLHANCAEGWTIEQLARQVGLSRSALADRFTALLGEPPMRYLARHRLNVAANLLRDGKSHANEVAYAVGFNSEAAFSRAFKKEFGVAPGAWRRERRAA
jgi:AraC-like DNA-binding protein